MGLHRLSFGCKWAQNPTNPDEHLTLLGDVFHGTPVDLRLVVSKAVC